MSNQKASTELSRMSNTAMAVQIIKPAIRKDSKVHKVNNTITTQIVSRFCFIAIEPQH